MPGTHPTPRMDPGSHAPKTVPWRIIFRVIRWTTYISAAITIAMVLHKTPPPHRPNQPPSRRARRTEIRSKSSKPYPPVNPPKCAWTRPS